MADRRDQARRFERHERNAERSRRAVRLEASQELLTKRVDHEPIAAQNAVRCSRRGGDEGAHR